jgi:acetylornithine/N-succinyldiaminopimelate aminotransferase
LRAVVAVFFVAVFFAAVFVGRRSGQSRSEPQRPPDRRPAFSRQLTRNRGRAALGNCKNKRGDMSETETESTSGTRVSVMLHQVRPEPIMVRGAGSWMWDSEGRRYLDFVQGWAVNGLGHAPLVVRQALQTQARTLINSSPAFLNQPQIDLCTTLAAAAGMDQVFLASTGAEANEGAVKLARKWGQLNRQGAHKVITTQGSFHGRTLAMMAASGKPGWDTLFAPQMPGFTKVPYGDAAAVELAIDGATAAIMVEPIQGEGGVVVPPAGYLHQMRAIADRAGILLILDEVQTGMGRTGHLFAGQAEGVRADVLTLGKGLGAGVPLAALLATTAASCFAPGEQGSTYSGTPLMSAVGLAVVRALTAPAFLPAVRARGDELVAGLQKLADRFGCPEVRGRGLLQALVLPQPVAEAVVRDARQTEGLLINAPRPNLLRFMPALNVRKSEIRTMLAALARSLERGLAA